MAEPAKINIVKGQDKTFTIYIRDKYGNPVDLTNATGITFRMGNQDGSTFSDTLSGGVSILTALIGKIQVVISDTNTALFLAGKNLACELFIDFSATRKIVQIENAVNVYAKKFT